MCTQAICYRTPAISQPTLRNFHGSAAVPEAARQRSVGIILLPSRTFSFLAAARSRFPFSLAFLSASWAQGGNANDAVKSWLEVIGTKR